MHRSVTGHMAEARKAWARRAAADWKALPAEDRMKMPPAARAAYEDAYRTVFPEDYKKELEEARKAGEIPPSVAEAARLVSQYLGVSPADIFGPGRSNAEVEARALYVALRCQFPEGGRPPKPISLATELGKDRTTVLHLLKVVLPRMAAHGEPWAFFQECGFKKKEDGK